MPLPDAFGPATRAWFDASFPAPTRVQELGWPAISGGRHALLCAPTGSGKTLAAFLWAVDRLLHEPPPHDQGVRVLYVSPLKALAYDVDRNLRAPLVGIGHAAARLGVVVQPVQVAVRTGDTPQRERDLFRRHAADIFITTPESLFLVLAGQARDTLRGVGTVIVDEIHALAPTKRGAHLALSLERLEDLVTTSGNEPPQRIGLSATQRPLDEVARYLAGRRPVHVVDAGSLPDLNVRIVVPVADMDRPLAAIGPVEPPPRYEDDDDLRSGPVVGAVAPRTFSYPEGHLPLPGQPATPGERQSIWPAVFPPVLDLIREHRTTIVFTNSRRLCERLAQALNEVAGEPLVRAYHGSVSREQRVQIEEDLKQGRLKAIVATSSLELGIDMGSVDLVIQVESPGSVARGLQRVGRAGHGVGQRSEGRVFPKFKGDLLEAAVVVRGMARGDIEPIRVPRNCLDVLAQQVVAACADHARTVSDLMALVQRTYGYQDLSPAAFASLLDMLSGRYPSQEFADLRPRLVWDREADRLSTRHDARRLAILNAGTIPDRGLFRVHLGTDGPRIGELDEEMVLESRPGDVFLLGATSWRIETIERDRVVVSPAPGQPGRMPFWRGDGPGRPIELGRAVGAFLRELDQRAADPEAAADWLVESCCLDRLAAGNLVSYVREQAAEGALPTDRRLVIERFRDELGDWRICLLTPFGARVHAPLAMVLEQQLAEAHGFDVQAMWTDDGVVLRLAATGDDFALEDDGGTALPDVEALLPDPDDVEALVTRRLADSALFAARFREAAARALLLPRRDPQKRRPLWLMRMRSANLLAVVKKYPAFPIVLETYRECLQDVFDLPALREILGQVRRRALKVRVVDTRTPSPFARSLVFAWVANYLYDGDAPLAERKAAALTLDRSLLAELLGQDELRELLDPVALDEVEAELQGLVDDRRVRGTDGLADLLRRLGDLSPPEVEARCAQDPAAWLQELAAARQALPVRVAGQQRWVAVEDAALYRDALEVSLPVGVPAAFLEPADRPLEALLARYARTHGPFTSAAAAGRFGLLAAQVGPALRALEAEGRLVQGELRPGGVEREWCDAEVLRRLRRRSLARLRREIEPVDGLVLARFLSGWQGLEPRAAAPRNRLQDAIDLLEGLPLSFQDIEGAVLPARVPSYAGAMLDELGALGEVVWIGRGALGARDGRVALYRREHVPLLLGALDDHAPPSDLHARLLAHLEQRGACFVTELQQAAGGAALGAVMDALWDLAWAGRVTNDTFQVLRGLGRQAAGRRSRFGKRGAPGGRWSAVSWLIGTDSPPDTERRHAWATLLLDRYGVVSREAAAAEDVPGGFSALYPVLQAMEDAGQARRGWFVDGLTGAQFARPGAVDGLRARKDVEAGGAVVLAATDPANPYGALLPWPQRDPTETAPARRAGARVVLVDGQAAFYLDAAGTRLTTFPAVDDEALAQAAWGALLAHVGRSRKRRLRLVGIDGVPPGQSPQLAGALAVGFHLDPEGATLELPL